MNDTDRCNTWQGASRPIPLIKIYVHMYKANRHLHTYIYIQECHCFAVLTVISLQQSAANYITNRFFFIIIYHYAKGRSRLSSPQHFRKSTYTNWISNTVRHKNIATSFTDWFLHFPADAQASFTYVSLLLYTSIPGWGGWTQKECRPITNTESQEMRKG
jgi:hypothetical protein